MPQIIRRRRAALLTGSALIAATAGLVIGPPAAQAQTEWNGILSTDWFTNANWSLGTPALGVDATIDTTANNLPEVAAAGAAAGALYVGRNVAGELTITSGGTLDTMFGYVGFNPGSTGTVTVTGTASTWTSSFGVDVGVFGGTGILTITNGGVVSTASGTIGSGIDGTGTVTVTGNGSRWMNSADLNVGYAGIGTLTVADGGRVESTIGFVGYDHGSTGTVTVTGSGSTWSNLSSIDVGFSGTGTLTIQQGGAVSSNGGYIGAFGSGTVTVSGQHSEWNNSGDLTIGDLGNGILTIANGGTVGNIVATIGNGPTGTGTVTVRGPGSQWISSGVITVGLAGTGTLTVADGGAVSAGGTVRVADQIGSTGTLNIGAAAGDAAVAPGTLAAALVQFGAGTGTLTFNHTATGYTFAPQIIGNGAVNVLSGTTILTAANTYTGPTTIDGGTLIVNGSIVSPVTVNAGTLGGSGTVGASTINAGTLSPGNSIGTLTVQGNLVLATAATYLVEINPTQADRTNVTGTAQLGGTLNVVATPGSYAPNTTYTILNAAGGRSGTFDAVTSSFGGSAFMTSNVSYDANNVYVSLMRTASFASVGQTPNQVATGAAVDTLGSGNPMFDAILVGSAAQARQAFDALSGEVHASATGVILDDSRFVRDAVIGRARQAYGGGPAALAALGPTGSVIAYAQDPGEAVTALAYAGKDPVTKAPIASPNERVLTSWTQAIGAFGRADGNGNAASLDRNVGGFFSGLDATFDRLWRLGVAAGYTRTSFDVDAHRSSASIDNFHAALYGGAQLGVFGLRGGAAYSRHELDVNRTVAFPGFFDAVKTDYDAHTAQVFGELGYGFALGRAAFEPFAGVAYVNLDTGGFTERGGAAALRAADQTHDTTFTTLGLRAATVVAVTEQITVTARGTLGWRHAFGDVTPALSLAFASGSAPFMIAGVPIAKDSAIVEAGFDVDVSANAKLGLAYAGQIADGADDHTVKGSFLWRF